MAGAPIARHIHFIQEVVEAQSRAHAEAETLFHGGRDTVPYSGNLMPMEFFLGKAEEFFMATQGDMTKRANAIPISDS